MRKIYAFAMIERVPASGGTFLLENAAQVIRIVKKLLSLTEMGRVCSGVG